LRREAVVHTACCEDRLGSKAAGFGHSGVTMVTRWTCGR